MKEAGVQFLGWEDPFGGGGYGNPQEEEGIRTHSNCHGMTTPFQYFCLENPMDRGAWWATEHKVTESWT